MTDEFEPLIVPVPAELRKRVSGVPTGLYLIPLPDSEGLLIAESDEGYFGIPTRCPHDNRKFRQTGIVDKADGTILCAAHCIRYSLQTGDPVANLGQSNDDPGRLKTYKVKRKGDFFHIESFG